MRFRVLRIGRIARGSRAGENRPQSNREPGQTRQETARSAQAPAYPPAYPNESSAQAARRAALQNPYSRYYSAPRTPEDLLKTKR
jgi:hypothetical protein